MRTPLSLLLPISVLPLAAGCYCSHLPNRFTFGEDGGRDAAPDAPADAPGTDADSGRQCVPERCDGFDNDCNGVPDNGADLACGSAPQATGVACTLGECIATNCAGSYHDCDGEFSNGCEQQLGSINHCLACNDACGWACRPTGCVDARANLSSGESHTCVIASDDRVLCWGANGSGQLGDGMTTRRLSPVPVAGLPAGAPTSVAAGTGHTCAVVEGSAYCWGANGSGQLGDGTTMTRTSPVAVRGLAAGAVTGVAAGDRHTCALTVSGAVLCWGENSSGQLGDGSTMSQSAPLTPALSGATAVTAGLDHACAIANGGVRCWGRNASGQLGDGTTMSRRSPATTILTSGATAIDAGSQHTCAIVSGRLHCWGENFSGQIGDDTAMDRSSPVLVTSVTGTVTGIAAGDTHTCATNTAGNLWCWGDNPDGRLGDGSMTSQRLPIEVVLSPAPAAIGAGGGGNGTFGMTCAVGANGAVSCWGDNRNGQIGDGTMVGRLSPTSVAAPP